MVIISAIALAIMISNHAVLPLSLVVQGRDQTTRLQERILYTRRIAIAFVLGLSFVYYRLTGQSDALAAMGLIAFVGVAQFFPALVAALFWPQAGARATFWALMVGFLVWGYTLALPTLSVDANWVQFGPYGFSWLRPQALLGATGYDPVVHATLWSLGLNTAVLILISLTSQQGALEKLQARLFVDAFSATSNLQAQVWQRTTALPDLVALARQILGPARASAILSPAAHSPNRSGNHSRPHSPPAATTDLVTEVEQELAATIGAASAHHLVSRISKGESLSVDDMALILDQTQQALGQAKALETKSKQLEDTAKSLRQALVQVRRLDRFKDSFLSKVSHELRTPMTSLKAFTDVLAHEDLPDDQRAEYFSIVIREINRLTSLLDELLDIRQSSHIIRPEPEQVCDLQTALKAAQDSFRVPVDQGQLHFSVNVGDMQVKAGQARLTQVFINLFSNALKYADQTGDQTRVEVGVTAQRVGDMAQILVQDKGPGFPEELADKVFDLYSRGSEVATRQGTGLGLAITRQILMAMGGNISVEPTQQGAGLRIEIPLV